MDAKLKWWEKMAKAGTRVDKELVEESAPSPRTVASEERSESTVARELPATRPGAVAVRGPEYRDSGYDDAWTTVHGGGGGDLVGGVEGTDEEEAALRVDSYVVRERLSDEEILQRILAGTARAEAVHDDEVAPSDVAHTSTPPQRRFCHRRKLELALLGVVIVTAIAVGIAVPRMKQTSDPQQPAPDVLASITGTP